MAAASAVMPISGGAPGSPETRCVVTRLIDDVVRIDSGEARERGRQRGAAIRARLHAGVEVYLSLFTAVGLSASAVRLGAERCLAAVERWSPELADELYGVAQGAGIDLWKVAALNARTEILAEAVGSRPGECSTMVHAGKNPVAAQTWDWHEELDDYWHLHDVRGNARRFVGLTEHGILGKIGVNDAGIGVLLNILGHQSDRVGAVPMHLVCARVLGEASTLDQAIGILRDAPVATSSAITVVAPDGGVVVELSPQGATVIQPVDSVLLHTNHFLTEALAVGEKAGLYDPDSQLRLAELRARVAAKPLPADPEGLIAYLVSQPGDEAELCCRPEDGAVFGQRWATLATVTIDPADRRISVAAGSPADYDPARAVTLRAR